MINIKGLNKADVLAALYNASHPQGLGALYYEPKDMTREEAQILIAKGLRFEYLKGRVMKTDLTNDEFDPWLYDRDNGPGTAERAISALRKL